MSSALPGVARTEGTSHEPLMSALTDGSIWPFARRLRKFLRIPGMGSHAQGPYTQA